MIRFDKKPAESQFSPIHALTKKDNENKLKQNTGQCERQFG